MTGLIKKFYVSRCDGRDLPGGDRFGTRYFVLDPSHDPAARDAIIAYAAVCDNPELADDLYDWMDQFNER